MTGRAQGEHDAGTTDQSRVEKRVDGKVVASADVTSSPEPHGTAKVALHSPEGDAPPDVRGDLVDEVMDRPGVSNSDDVHVVLPLGDSESISRLQQRTTNFSARAAGASAVIDAEVEQPATEEQV